MTSDVVIECEGCAKQKQSSKDFIAEMLEAGKRWDGRHKTKQPEPKEPEAKPKSEPSEPEPNSARAFIDEMLEASKRWSGEPIKPDHNKPDTKAWTDEMKMEACPRNGGKGYGKAKKSKGLKKANIRKMPSGETYILPRYCNMCEGCYKHHAKELKERMEYIDALARHNSDGGHWRKAVVEDDKEAKALKKKVNRNQEGRHVEYAADKPNHNVIWTFVDNNTKNPEKHGEEANPEDINFDEVYKRNRETGKKFSVGKAFKHSAVPPKGNTVRIIIPEIVVDAVDTDKAEKIVRETNYIKEANDARDAEMAYADEFKYILLELEKEGIEVLAVDHRHYNIDPERLLEEWNRKCKYWMSLNAPLPLNDSGAKVDITNRLYYPENEKEAHKEPLI